MIPGELQGLRQWVCWTRVDRTHTKLPISPVTGKAASCTDPATWGSYRQARTTASKLQLDGIGFVFTSSDPLTGVDLDHCRKIGGDLESWAAAIVDRLKSYTEWSPSGEGLHVLVRAALSNSAGRRTRGVEIYSSGRYFTVTGHHLDRTPKAIESRQTEILDLVAGFENNRRHLRTAIRTAPLPQNNEELLRRARQAKNGLKFERLWAGDTFDYAGDHSRADAALCSLLTYYTNGDEARIDRLFRQSSLYRKKWDRPTAGSTYGAITIQAVLGGSYR